MASRVSLSGSIRVAPARAYLTPWAGLVATRHTWWPPLATAANLSTDYSLAVDVVAGPDGSRRVYPAEPLGSFVLAASLGGQALLAAGRGFDARERGRYHAMRLVYQMAGLFREHLDRRFTRAEHLSLDGPAAAGLGDRHVLPAHVGLDADGRGTPWSPAELMAEGRAAAGAAAGPEEWIRRGLLEAARRNPLDPARLTRDECAAVVRMALFDFGPLDGPLGGAKAAAVRERLFAAMARRENQGGPAFFQWLHGDLDNLVHGLAKRKSDGGRLTRVEVRQGLLDLAWGSFHYVGDCVHAQMRAVAAALPEPLSPADAAVFEAAYCAQGYLGGLPLVLLRDRFAWLRGSVLGLWGSPGDPARAGAVLRMLEYYGSMVRVRRQGDLAAKTPRFRAGASSRGGTVTLDGDHVGGPRAGHDDFQAVAAELRERRRASCPCGGTSRWHAVFGGEQEGAIVIDEGCGGCGHRETVTVPYDEFRATAVGLV